MRSTSGLMARWLVRPSPLEEADAPGDRCQEGLAWPIPPPGQGDPEPMPLVWHPPHLGGLSVRTAWAPVAVMNGQVHKWRPGAGLQASQAQGPDCLIPWLPRDQRQPV